MKEDFQIDQPEIIVNRPGASVDLTPIKTQPTVVTPDKLIEQTRQNLMLLEQMKSDKL